jgi:hypothetical protein
MAVAGAAPGRTDGALALAFGVHHVKPSSGGRLAPAPIRRVVEHTRTL